MVGDWHAESTEGAFWMTETVLHVYDDKCWVGFEVNHPDGGF